MALSDNTVNSFRHVKREDSFKVLASVHIYRGAALGLSPSGYAKPFEAADPFIGFATEEFYASGTDGGASIRGNLSLAGQTDLQVITGGEVLVTLAAVTVKDRGKPVFATSDNAFALIGHPDAFVGYVTTVESSTTCYVRIKEPGEIVRKTDGVHNINVTGDEMFTAITAAGSAILAGGQLIANVVGSTFASGSFNVVQNVAGGEWKGLLGTTSEAENISIETAMLLTLTYGMSMRFRGRVSALGGSSTTEFSAGLYTASSSTMTAGIRANPSVTTSGIGRAAIATLGDSTTPGTIFARIDDNATLTGVDTAIANSLTVNKDWIILIRPTGVVEMWADGVRVLSTTTLSVGTSLTTYWGGLVTLAKSTAADAAAFNLQHLQVKGASLPA